MAKFFLVNIFFFLGTLLSLPLPMLPTPSCPLLEVEGGGTNETNEGLTDRTEHAMIAPFIITDVNSYQISPRKSSILFQIEN